jgi:hypothetical protein
VSRRRQILGLVVAIAALAMLAPATAIAGGGSAGDQQYVDPLGGSGSSGSGSHSGSTSTQPSAPTSTSASSSSSSSAATSSSGASASNTATTTSASLSTKPADPSTSSSTLPRTGLDVGLVVAVGVSLLGCGLALRRTVHPH